MEHLRTRSGEQIQRLKKPWHTDTPSIQGVWTPFTNRDSKYNLVDYPCPELSQFKPPDTSATERLLQMAEELRAERNVIIEEEKQ